jgi:predicted transcriptional regulator
MAVTTIKLQKETKQRLDKLKEHSRESYDEIIKKVLYVLNVVRESPDKAKGILEFIDEKKKKMTESEE